MIVNGYKIKIWQVIVSVGVVLGLIGGFFTMEDRWNQSDEVLAAEADFDNKLLIVSKETIKTFESYQMKQSVETKGMKLEILDMQYKRLRDEYYKVRKELKANPDDIDLKEELERIKKDMDRIHDKKAKILGE